MKLSGLHILLTYQCTLECDHCFVWGSSWQTGTMPLENLRGLLQQAKDLGTIESIYFEGGEPFLYYGLLLAGTRVATGLGFQVGVESNGYWATSVEDALEWLRPFVGLWQDLSISSDQYHGNERLSQPARNARVAAEQLGIPLGVISIAQPQAVEAASATGQIPSGESAVMYRGRAAQKLATRAAPRPWDHFAACPYEDLREPGRIHVDPLGNVHICQGIALGNVFQTSLKEICETYDPEAHPITGPLLAGGPAELARRYNVLHADHYADACHLCDAVRRTLRGRFPAHLRPDQMYGVPAG